MLDNILPDSRLKEAKATVFGDFEFGDTKTRIEWEMIFCANCGKEYGYVPKENTVFTCYLCNKCFETYGHVVGTFVQSDEEFCQNVAFEMMERFGRYLTDDELTQAKQNGTLGTAL